MFSVEKNVTPINTSEKTGIAFATHLASKILKNFIVLKITYIHKQTNKRGIARIKVSAAMLMRFSLFYDFTQRGVVILY
jgi:hypothetical protein